MLKQRIKKIENQIKPKGPQKKGGKLWYVRVDEAVSGLESADLEKVEQELIADIKSGKIEHPDGGFYSEDEHNMFITVVPTGRAPDKFYDDD